MKLSVGLGCDRGALLETLNSALDAALTSINATRAHIAVFATIDKKNDEVAFLDLTRSENKMLLFFTAEQLAQVRVPNPSNTVLKFMGTPAVAEAAALLAADTTLQDLLVEKHKLRGTDGKNVTISIVRIPL
ncbi:MAG: cobalamin biosynthesis protein [Pseudomonadales bacterium]